MFGLTAAWPFFSFLESREVQKSYTYVTISISPQPLTKSKFPFPITGYSCVNRKVSCLKHTACTGFQMAKKCPLLIQHSRSLRDSQEPKTKRNFQFSRGLFQKIPFLYFFLHKSWIWRTMGHVIDIFSYCHFQTASKECF